MGITALLIYSIFSLSFIEKKKYVGLLSCVGASLWQRCVFILEEGIIIGLVSIPIGILMGSFGSAYVVNILNARLEETYQLGINLSYMPDLRVALLVAILGMCTVTLAIMIPTVQAARINPLQLIFHAGESKPEENKIQYYHALPVEMNMAIRNLLCNKRKCIKIIIFAAMSIVIAFNGYIEIQSMRGTYLLEDTREEQPLDAWVLFTRMIFY